MTNEYIHDESQPESSVEAAVQEAEAQDPGQETALAATKPEAEAILAHDGIGLSLEAARNLIMQKNNEVIGVDDPILMLVTINNAFLSEYDKLMERHNKAVSGVMQAKLDSYVSGVEGSLAKLTKEISGASMAAIGETIQNVFHEHALTLNSFSGNMKWASIIIAVSALVNVAVFVIGAIK